MKDGLSRGKGKETYGISDADRAAKEKIEVRRAIIDQIKFLVKGLTYAEIYSAIGTALDFYSVDAATKEKVEEEIDSPPSPTPVIQLPRLAHPATRNTTRLHYRHSEEQLNSFNYHTEEQLVPIAYSSAPSLPPQLEEYHPPAATLPYSRSRQ